jgi:hypothetical protein
MMLKWLSRGQLSVGQEYKIAFPSNTSGCHLKRTYFFTHPSQAQELSSVLGLLLNHMTNGDALEVSYAMA